MLLQWKIFDGLFRPGRENFDCFICSRRPKCLGNRATGWDDLCIFLKSHLRHFLRTHVSKYKQKPNYEQMWAKCLENTSMTINAHHTLIHLKVIYRPCFSPSRIHKLFKGTSPIYVICSRDQGTLTHQFIQGNRLLTFWGSPI